jgi:putative ABC transport system substrate-binding protein
MRNLTITDQSSEQASSQATRVRAAGHYQRSGHRRSAAYVDRILKDDRPGLPVQNPTKFDLVINLKTAKALDIIIALSLLATADEVIE